LPWKRRGRKRKKKKKKQEIFQIANPHIPLTLLTSIPTLPPLAFPPSERGAAEPL